MFYLRLGAYIGIFSIFILAAKSCKDAINNQELTDQNAIVLLKEEVFSQEKKQDSDTKLIATDSLSEKLEKEIGFPIPKGFVLFEKEQGDLNGDGLDDAVFLVKGTNKERVILDEHLGMLDRNRRGLLIYLSNDRGNDLIIKNLTCFSSEQEDGDGYFAPELSVEIKNGKLFIHYSHGRYGNWKYTFRHQNSDFELIGYDLNDYDGPIINGTTSINFLTKRKRIERNINENTEEGGEEIFEKTWEDIVIKKLLRLSEVEDFDYIKY
ncbi:MAG: hypothetical protein ACRBFS_14505 [Aureispira sp.]